MDVAWTGGAFVNMVLCIVFVVLLLMNGIIVYMFVHKPEDGSLEPFVSRPVVCNFHCFEREGPSAIVLPEDGLCHFLFLSLPDTTAYTNWDIGPCAVKMTDAAKAASKTKFGLAVHASRGEASCSLLRPEQVEGEEEKQQERAQPSAEDEHDVLRVAQSGPTCAGVSKPMPTIMSQLEGKKVPILRDTGSDTVVVKRSRVPNSKLTGSTRIIRLLDRSAKKLPEAEVYIDSPFFKGHVHAVYMENPLYGVVLGNIEGVYQIDDAKCEQAGSELSIRSAKDSHKVGMTAATRKKKEQQQLPAAQVNPLSISPDELRKLQSTDPTLEACFAALDKRSTSKKQAVTEFVLVRASRHPLPALPDCRTTGLGET
ncbi:hypothetical protein HPB49_018203 [Dermacentor silvarum]|uniref:Uncharacterized protein n=1 Tax=Dermacentor silvarum TaxID=543639 RepID=A0ACB8CZ54_DERSI|nr:hypothetical protein HPB49_018203 [Dermacentor silvarum]